MSYELKEKALQPVMAKGAMVSESEKRERVAAFEERLSREGFTNFTVSDIERLWNVCEDYFFTSKGVGELLPVAAVTTRSDDDVKVEVCKMVTSRCKNGREKKAYGVKFHVDGKEYPLHFQQKTATMIYVCTLLRHKMGKRLSNKDFYKVPQGLKSDTAVSQEWVKSVYDTLFPLNSKDYREWECNLRNAHWDTRLHKEVDRGGIKHHPMSQGVSSVRSGIKAALAECAGVLDLLTVNTDKKEGGSCYTLKLKPENIIIPEELEELLRA